MDRDVLKTFVALEIRRVLPALRRSTVLVAVIGLGMALLGLATASRMAWLLGFLAVNYALMIPGQAFRDKLDGTTEFMVTLPVPMSVLAGARLLACALASAPAAAVITAALGLGLPSVGLRLEGVGVTLELGLAIWLLATTVSYLGLALTTTLRLGALNYVLLGGIGVIWGGGTLIERLVPDPVGTFTRLVEQPWFLPAFGTGAVLAIAALLGVSYTLLRIGLERFRPERDAITF